MSQETSATAGLLLIYCPNCKTRPVVPGFFDVSVLSGNGRIQYDCSECGYNTIQHFHDNCDRS
jgi:DNA-directed RNA polymerase subunit RPC12/RpoP